MLEQGFADAASQSEPPPGVMADCEPEDNECRAPGTLQLTASGPFSPFTWLVDAAPVRAAARRAEALVLPRRAVYLFGKKGVTSDPEIGRLDDDVEFNDASEEED